MLLSSISLALTRLCQQLGRWSPLALWPDGIATPGMWISPRDLTSQWADYTGTTPVVTPGTVADSVNPVGLALDIRAGATVLTDPGNHMLQSTSTSRPLLSARVNLLTYTEDFSNSVWNVGVVIGAGASMVKTPNYSTAPDGSVTACRVLGTAPVSGSLALLRQTLSAAAGTIASNQCWIKSNTGVNQDIWFGNSDGAANIITVTPTWTLYKPSAGTTGQPYLFFDVGATYPDVTAIDVSIWHPQTEIGTTATDYQPILTDGSTYPSTGFPIAQKYDGTDDGMATAAFAAGTLINGMDCMIAVRRDSAALVIAGLYETAGSGTRYTGYAEIGTPGLCFAGAGAPTVWVDDVQLSGGTSVTAGTLHTALTVGDWHILEFRNLDLSAWTAAAFGRYTGGIFNGPRGDILLYPSTTPTADKDAARQWLADYYGVTLP